jgi:hypothetical protein
LLVEHPTAAAFEHAAEFMINRIVRPNTARWHGWIKEERLKEAPVRRQFRLELQRLQRELIAFSALLRLLVGGPANSQRARDHFAVIAKGTLPPQRPAQLGDAVTAGIGPEIVFAKGKLPGGLGEFASAEEINRKEARFLRRRRHAADAKVALTDEPISDAVGLCLSGGGIRSATFCLGVVQVLARQGILRQCDYLSTVFRRRLPRHLPFRLSRHAEVWAASGNG